MNRDGCVTSMNWLVSINVSDSGRGAALLCTALAELQKKGTSVAVTNWLGGHTIDWNVLTKDSKNGDAMRSLLSAKGLDPALYP